MNKLVKTLIFLFILLAGTFSISAQDAGSNIIRGIVSSKIDGPLMSVHVVEVDQNKRYISTTVTDINGNFALKVKNTSNKLQVSYVGMKTQLLTIGSRTYFNIVLEDATTISEVTVRANRTVNTGTLTIPERERSMAMQTISSKEFEGLSVASVDDALQGKIAGLDIIANSGDVGSGSSMRIRGITSINNSSEPLIVLNGVIYDTPQASTFEFATANQEQFADLLSINVDDIESITVLKDAASTAMWGSRGANGVISINTKKGIRGKTRVQYTYRYSGAIQPQGYTMLTGDDYTMLMKEAYFNPRQSNTASNIREFNYDPSFSEYENYNNNTNWVKAVTDRKSVV